MNRKKHTGRRATLPRIARIGGYGTALAALAAAILGNLIREQEDDCEPRREPNVD